MILCPACGNKRCPRASDHRFACTGSNDVGQFGSLYGERPWTETPAPNAKRVLDALLRTGGYKLEDHGHRRRGTGCDDCNALYEIADALGVDLDAPSETGSGGAT